LRRTWIAEAGPKTFKSVQTVERINQGSMRVVSGAQSATGFRTIEGSVQRGEWFKPSGGSRHPTVPDFWTRQDE
jgi:hypothetical protein